MAASTPIHGGPTGHVRDLAPVLIAQMSPSAQAFVRYIQDRPVPAQRQLLRQAVGYSTGDDRRLLSRLADTL